MLWDRTFTTPFQNFPSFFLGSPPPPNNVGLVAGTFTIWVRRPLETDPFHRLSARASANDQLVLTSEGTAPQTGLSDIGLANRAVRYLEVSLNRLEPGDCENRTGQIGGGPGGSGYDGCDTVKKEGILGGVGEPNPGQQ